MPLEARAPTVSSLSTFMSFLTCGAIPLVPFVFQLPHPFALSTGLTGLTFFFIGSVKARWSLVRWWRSGLETLLVGSVAASLASAVGYLLRSLGAG